MTAFRLLVIAALGATLCVGMAAAQTSVPAQPASVPAEKTPAKRISIGDAAILGVVEGITEYLPVSSTGHLILAGYWMGLTRSTDHGAGWSAKLEKVPAIDAFEVVIQLGAILAVVGLYRRRVGQMATGLVGRNPSGLRLVGLLLVAFLPAAVAGLAFHKPIEEHLFGPLPVAIALAVGGVLMIGVEYLWRHNSNPDRRLKDIGQMAYWQAFVIGLAQCLAMWPGTSRSMITILAALVVGLDMLAAAEFSFLLALPTLGAATFYAGYKSWPTLIESAGIDGLLVGLLVSGVVAALAVKVFVKWLTRHGLAPFGVYRILLAAGLLWALLA